MLTYTSRSSRYKEPDLVFGESLLGLFPTHIVERMDMTRIWIDLI